MMIKHY